MKAKKTNPQSRFVRGANGLFGLAWLAWMLAGPAEACRFNVRDVGFVELGRSLYQFYWFVDEGVPVETVTSLQAVSKAALLDTNIRPEVLSVKDVPGHGAEESFRRHAAAHTPPWAALVAPDGRSLSLRWDPSEGAGTMEAGLWTFLERLYASPRREELQEKIIRSYGVVLVVEGRDPGENGRVRAAANQVVQDLARSMESLPKEIKFPPVLMWIDQATAAQEKVFLWSLGLDDNPPAEAHAAVLYGRGRLMGSVLTGPDITATRLLNLMGTIGLSCECGLDRSSMQGSMIPLRWDDRVLTRLAGLLGFDPESPMIKMEMSQILSKGQNSRGEAGRRGAVATADADLFLGYTEEILPREGDPGPGGIDPGMEGSVVHEPAGTGLPLSPSSSAVGRDTGASAQDPALPDTGGGWRRAWGILGIMGLAVFTGGFFLLWLRRG